MTKKENSQNSKPRFGFKLFKRYVRFFHNNVYYRKVYAIDQENIPENCPLMIVSNHQNSLCDPLGLLLTIRSRKKRKLRVIARGDIFQNRFANKALRWMGLVPAYRLSHDGEESLANNADTFEEVEQELLNDGTVIIFPEGKHQDKRWLGKFSYGYLRILFEAAQKSNFEKEMFILPACNHYSNYFEIQEKVVFKFGKPISIAPYYELYKTKPRTAQRQVNEIVRQQVLDLMLNVNDLDNYNAIDCIRNTYGVKYAKDNGSDPSNLHEKLLSDKQLVAKLETAKQDNESLLLPIYDNVLTLEEKAKPLRINDWNFEKPYILWKTCFFMAFLILFFPLFAFALIPNAMLLYVPKMLTSKVKDPMLHSAIFLVSSLLFTIPLLYFLMFSLTWIFTNSFWIALIYLVSLPTLGVFAWHYKKLWKYMRSQIRFHKLAKNNKIDDLINLREQTFKSLDNILK